MLVVPSEVVGPGHLSPLTQGSKGRTLDQTALLWMEQQPDGKKAPSDAWNLDALSAVRRQLQRERVASQQLNFDTLSGSVGDDAGAAPVFLRKTYRMIDNCPPELGGWSDAGDTFVVKDPDSFSLMQIPQYFRHSNFSSFVRQLNFYGFRKVKTDQHGLQRSGKTGEANKVWEFRHPLFKRAQPQLLNEIKKKSDFGEEMAALRGEVLVLRNRCESMTVMIENLCGVVESLVQRVRLLESDKRGQGAVETGLQAPKRLKTGDYVQPPPSVSVQSRMAHIPEMPSPMISASSTPRHLVSPTAADPYVQQVLQARMRGQRVYPGRHHHPTQLQRQAQRRAAPQQVRPQQGQQQHPQRSQAWRREFYAASASSQDVPPPHNPQFGASISQEEEGASKDDLTFFEEMSSLLKDHQETRGNSGGG